MSLPGAVPPSAPVTVDGVASIDEELKGFAAYVKSKYPNTTSTALQRPYIDDVIHPAATEDFGISDELVEDSESTVTVLVALDAKTAEQDYLGLFWGGIWLREGKSLVVRQGSIRHSRLKVRKSQKVTRF